VKGGKEEKMKPKNLPRIRLPNNMLLYQFSVLKRNAKFH
jgi:hypothetical protein